MRRVGILKKRLWTGKRTDARMWSGKTKIRRKKKQMENVVHCRIILVLRKRSPNGNHLSTTLFFTLDASRNSGTTFLPHAVTSFFGSLLNEPWSPQFTLKRTGAHPPMPVFDSLTWTYNLSCEMLHKGCHVGMYLSHRVARMQRQ